MKNENKSRNEIQKYSEGHKTKFFGKGKIGFGLEKKTDFIVPPILSFFFLFLFLVFCFFWVFFSFPFPFFFLFFPFNFSFFSLSLFHSKKIMRIIIISFFFTSKDPKPLSYVSPPPPTRDTSPNPSCSPPQPPSSPQPTSSHTLESSIVSLPPPTYEHPQR